MKLEKQFLLVFDALREEYPEGVPERALYKKMIAMYGLNENEAMQYVHQRLRSGRVPTFTENQGRWQKYI